MAFMLVFLSGCIIAALQLPTWSLQHRTERVQTFRRWPALLRVATRSFRILLREIPLGDMVLGSTSSSSFSRLHRGIGSSHGRAQPAAYRSEHPLRPLSRRPGNVKRPVELRCPGAHVAMEGLHCERGRCCRGYWRPSPSGPTSGRRLLCQISVTREEIPSGQDVSDSVSMGPLGVRGSSRFWRGQKIRRSHWGYGYGSHDES